MAYGASGVAELAGMRPWESIVHISSYSLLSDGTLVAAWNQPWWGSIHMKEVGIAFISWIVDFFFNPGPPQLNPRVSC